MATITVTIAADGTFSPASISVNAGDIVFFQAAADTVLCVDPTSLFGAERFEIPEGGSIGLVVQPDPPQSFQYIAQIGDLEARCGGGRDKTGGSGGGTGGG